MRQINPINGKMHYHVRPRLSRLLVIPEHSGAFNGEQKGGERGRRVVYGYRLWTASHVPPMMPTPTPTPQPAPMPKEGPSLPSASDLTTGRPHLDARLLQPNDISLAPRGSTTSRRPFEISLPQRLRGQEGRRRERWTGGAGRSTPLWP